MSSDDITRSLTRAAELVQHGPSAVPARAGVRGLLRRVLIRLLRPYLYYQQQVDREIVSSLRRQVQIFEHLTERHSEQIERLEDLTRELIHTAESLRQATVQGKRETLAEIGSLRDELQARPYMADEPFEAFQTSVGQVLGFRSRAALSINGSGYVAFEDLFRGPADRVTTAQHPYLSLVREHQPVLDLGCGRGEFLALLAKQGIAVRGVDSDAGMVEHCRKLGVEIDHADLNDYLASVPDASFGTIFSAQVIEHLPYEALRQMLELALRKLKPGGLLIAETVNPHRIASLKTFWVDLTHQHPIFPEVALAMCGIAGFESAYVFAPAFGSFQDALTRSPAYAVVATSSARLDASI